MTQALGDRSGLKCELCGSEQDLRAFSLDGSEDLHKNIHLCQLCDVKITSKELDDHFRCLSGSMWSEHQAVQTLTYRILSKMSDTPWARDLFDQMYLDDDAIALAKLDETLRSTTIDANGVELAIGDTVTLIKDLVVKGANFTAKRGTVVKGIRLSDNPLHIEGKVNGTRVVLVSDFVKKV